MAEPGLVVLLAVIRSRHAVADADPPLPGKMTPLQPNHIQPPGGLMERSNASIQRDGQS